MPVPRMRATCPQPHNPSDRSASDGVSWHRPDASPFGRHGGCMALQAGSPTRRHGLAWLLAATLLLGLGASPARAELADLAKAAAWRLGDQLSLTGLLYAQGNQDARVEELLTGMKPLAE